MVLTRHGGPAALSHRISWLICYGSLPVDKCVLHNCDNPSCVNPQHLFLGTRLDNNVDRMLKNRNGDISGEKHPGCKLNRRKVSIIRHEMSRKNGSTAKSLAQRFGVSVSQIRSVAKYETWTLSPPRRVNREVARSNFSRRLGR
jgi:HNH endonuclease